MSRDAMMDIFLVTFVVWGLVAFTTAIAADHLTVRRRQMYLAFSGALLGSACACKWNGVDTLCAIIAVTVLLLWRRKNSKDATIVRYGENLAQIGALGI